MQSIASEGAKFAATLVYTTESGKKCLGQSNSRASICKTPGLLSSIQTPFLAYTHRRTTSSKMQGGRVEATAMRTITDKDTRILTDSRAVKQCESVCQSKGQTSMQDDASRT